MRRNDDGQFRIMLISSLLGAALAMWGIYWGIIQGFSHDVIMVGLGGGLYIGSLVLNVDLCVRTKLTNWAMVTAQLLLVAITIIFLV